MPRTLLCTEQVIWNGLNNSRFNETELICGFDHSA
jgi:hypothetical protein